MDEKLKAFKALLDEIRTTYNTYIGARYVPRFTGLYDVTQSYEALDVVDNGSGTSYIAKKPTPAGTPLTDTDYWFLYGSTNGAIVNLQQQINDMKDGTVPGSLQDQINDNTSDITALTNEKANNSAIIEESAHNLIPFLLPEVKTLNASTGTWYANKLVANTGSGAVEFTVNDDGSITVNTTVGARSDVIYFKVAKKYFGDTNIYTQTGHETANGYTISGGDGMGSASNFYLHYTAASRLIEIVVTTSASISNVTVYPMIRYSEDNDPTFKPYAMTNREVTEIVQYDDYLADKKIAIFGDSLSMPAPDVGVWAVYFKSYCEYRGCTVDNFALAGSGIADVANTVSANLNNTYDICIVACGTNEFGQNFETIKTRVESLYTALSSYTGDLWIMTPVNRTSEWFNGATPSLDMISAYMYNRFSPKKNVRVISMNSFGIHNFSDSVHPTPAVGNEIGKCVVKAISNRMSNFNMQTGSYKDLTKPTITGNDGLAFGIHTAYIEDVNSIRYKLYATVTPTNNNPIYNVVLDEDEYKTFFKNSFIDRFPVMIYGNGKGYIQLNNAEHKFVFALNNVGTGSQIEIIADALIPVMKNIVQ